MLTVGFILKPAIHAKQSGSAITDRDRLEGLIEAKLYDEGLEGEELDKAVKAKIEELEPYWINVICIYADN